MLTLRHSLAQWLRSIATMLDTIVEADTTSVLPPQYGTGCWGHMLLQARGSDKDSWADIYPSQLEHFAHRRYQVRALELNDEMREHRFNIACNNSIEKSHWTS